MTIDIRKPVPLLILAAAFGLLGGGVTFWAQGVLPPWLSLWANSILPWTLFALAAGLVAPTRRLAVAAGILTEVCLVFGYYQLSDRFNPWWERFDWVWLLAGVVAGTVCGLLGRAIRRAGQLRRILLTSLATGLAFGEGLEFALRTDSYFHGSNVVDGAIFMAAAAAAALLVGRSPRSRAIAVAATVGIGLAVVVILRFVLEPVLQLLFLGR